MRGDPRGDSHWLLGKSGVEGESGLHMRTVELYALLDQVKSVWVSGKSCRLLEQVLGEGERERES